MKLETRRALTKARREAIDVAFIIFLLLGAFDRFSDAPRSFQAVALQALLTGLLVGFFKFWNHKLKYTSDPRVRDR